MEERDRTRIKATEMNEDDSARRISQARRAIDELIEIVHGEGPWAVQWYRMLLDVRDALAATESPRDALGTASAMFDALYSRPYNFADFYIARPDRQERIAANQRFSEIVDEVREALHGDETQ
jgi:hypothetical protein